MIKKIIIGTAQFGFDYGIKNKVGKIDKENIIKILKLAQNRKQVLANTSPRIPESGTIMLMGDDREEKSLEDYENEIFLKLSDGKEIDE